MPNDIPQTFDNYTITRRAFAKGSVGVIHDAVDSSGQRVAIKVFDSEAVGKKIAEEIKKTARDPAEITEKTSLAHRLNVEKFKEEYQILVRLNHPNVAKVLKIGFFENQLYIVSEFIEGKPIAEYVRGWKPADMIPIFVDALKGLDYIHRSGLLHLDIKSGNILVRMVDGKPDVKIIDFGLSMAPAEYEGGFLGSVNYMAPEVVLGLKEKVDARADLFSFGVVMYYCITWGFSFPFPRPTDAGREFMRKIIEREPSLEHHPPSRAHQSRPGYVPEFLDKIVMRLVAHDPKDRFYGNARAVINALQTKTPDIFRESAESRASYLIPKGNKHIGRDKEREKIFGWLDPLLENHSFQPPVMIVGGGAGLGKSHLLQKISERAARRVESVSLNNINFPSDESQCDIWSEKVESSLLEKTTPVVILIDDLHELAASLELEKDNPHHLRIKHIIERASHFVSSRHQKTDLFAGTPPVFLFLTFDDSKTTFDKIKKVFNIPANYLEMISLKPLTLAELDSYLKSTPALENRTYPREWLHTLHKRTGGAPAAIREQLYYVDCNGMLFDIDGNVALNPSLAPPSAPPPTIREKLLSLFGACDASDRKILEFLSVWCFKHAAPPPSYDDLSHFLPSETLKQRLSGLVQREILEIDPAGIYEFVNRDYFPALIYELMPEDKRKSLHDRICIYNLAKKTDADIADLHKCYGSDEREGIKAIVRLGRRKLFQKGDVYLAQSLFMRGLDLIRSAKRPKLFAHLSAMAMDAHQQAGEYAKTEKIFNEAMESVKSTPGGRMLTTILITKMTGVCVQRRRHADVLLFLNEARRLLNNCPPTLLSAVLLNYEARDFHEQALEEPDRKIFLLQRAREIFEKSESLEKNFSAKTRLSIRNNNIGLVLIALGEYQKAISKLEEKLARHEKEANLFGVLFSAIALADAYRLSGNFDKAEKMADRAIELAKKANQARWLMHAHQAMANILHDENRFEEALIEDDHLLACSAFLDDSREHERISFGLWTHKGHCYKELKNFDKAILHFQAVLDGNADPFFAMSAHEGMGEVFFMKGSFKECLHHLDAAWSLLTKMPKDAVEIYRSNITRLKKEISSGSSPDPHGK